MVLLKHQIQISNKTTQAVCGFVEEEFANNSVSRKEDKK